MKKLFFLIIVIGALHSGAQDYGGFAQVFVKNKEGKTRVLTATILCTKSTQSSAKSSLEYELRRDSTWDEEFASPIDYKIILAEEDDNFQYGGTATVKVLNKEGETRYLSATILCVKSTVCQAMSSLEYELIRDKRYDEEFVEKMTFDIDKCED